MIELIYNVFNQWKIYLNSESREIKFEYVQHLFCLQENEGCHFANELQKSMSFLI